MSKTKMFLKLTALILPLIYLGFLLADRMGVWSRLRGLDKVETVAARFEKSYAPDASHPVSVGDPEWRPLIALIYRYSSAEFPPGKEPQTVARFPAPVSGQLKTPDGRIAAEWTAPSTPFAVLYRKWPGQEVPPEDWRVAGSIGDLRSWILRSKDELRFMVKDVFFVFFSFVVGLLLFLHEHRTTGQNSQSITSLPAGAECTSEAKGRGSKS